MSSVPSKEQIGVLERQRRSASRIRALLFMQMGDKLRKRTRRQRRRFAFLLFLQILAAVAVTAICTVLCNVLANTFHVPMDRDMLAAIFLLTQLISIIANVGTIQDILFTDRENSMLLTFPCTFREIAISKLLLFFMRELKKNCFFLLPFLFGFAIATAQSPAFFLFAIGAYLLLSALPIFVACVLSIAFLYVNRWLQSIPLLYATVLSLFFAGIFYVAYRILLLLPDPLRFLQEYASYIARITDVVDAVARFSLHYGSLADILTGDGRLFDWVLVLVASAVITVAGITLLLPFYFRAVSSSAERSTREKKVRVRRHESSSLTAARGRFGHLALYRTFYTRS